MTAAEKRALIFATRINRDGLPAPLREFRFHDTRQWRFDYAWPDQKVALEVEGGFFKKDGGRHSRGAGARKDMEKYNAAVLDGWKLLRVMPDQLNNASTLQMLRTVLA